MTHGSLFSGIGGFDLAAEWMGWENKFHCEWNTFGQKVLHHYWPQAEQFTDIKKTDFTKYANRIDILTGGFPCQPYSSAGKRLGKEDERHLWPEMLRAIREIQPRWVVGENVLGLVNWSDGLVFHEVQADLEAEGYEVQPYVLPAVSVNAPHRRDRVWFVAYSARASERANQLSGLRCKDGEIGGEGSQTIHHAFRSDGIEGITSNPNSNGLNQCNSDNEVNTSEGRINALGDTNKSNGDGITSNSLCNRIGESRERRQSEQLDKNGIKGGNVADTDCRGLERSTQVGWDSEYAIGQDGIIAQTRDSSNSSHIRREDALENQELERMRFGQSHQRNAWDSFPSVSPICTGDDGISDRLDSITFPKWRNESIKAGGNAIVPQLVYQIFKTIEQYERISTPDKNS
jgi:DNA (cytosine-5)-methyltransferase 1